jgi:hypothetical protein
VLDFTLTFAEGDAMMKFLIVFSVVASPAIADDLQPPNAPTEWPMSKVRCTNIDFDSTDGQASSQICTQVWFNDSEKCYYSAIVDLTDGVWRVRSKNLMRFRYTGDPRCTPNTHPVPPPVKSRVLPQR